MAENKTLLMLCLEGALQSWGEDSKWDLRDTADMPTKSGIVGILACAMGLERNDPMICELSEALTIAVREDRKGTRMLDYQTVTGNPLINAEGKKRSLGNTFISPRQYIQDACFVVMIECNDSWRERIVYALKHPKWCVYLGRKNCVPSRPILLGITQDYANLPDALEHYPIQDKRDSKTKDSVTLCRYESEIPNERDAAMSRQDVRLPRGYRQFTRRKVWRGIAQVKEAPHVSE